MKLSSLGVLAILVSVLVMRVEHAAAIEIETFTQPYLTIDVPASDMGVLTVVTVEIGTRVQKDQLLAQVDDRVLRASLALADAAVRATSSVRAAEAELALSEQQLRSYRELLAEGNATQREIDRAENNYWQATTRLLTANEEAEIRELERQRITSQIESRKIRSPIDGIVVKINKDAGEFVSPTDPIVMQVVQLDRLRAVFSVPITLVETLEKSQRVKLRCGHEGSVVEGMIEIISPVAEPESASVRVHVRIDNPKGKLRSGVLCRWDMKANAS